MPFRTLLKFRNLDVTKDIDDRLRNLVQKGIFFGGQVTPVAGTLQVDIQPFAAMGSDGMVTILEGTAERVDLQPGATNHIILHSTYVANGPPVTEVENLTTAEFNALNAQELSERILFAKIPLSIGAVEVETSDINIDEADLVDSVGRISFRGVVETSDDLPDFTNPPTGITRQNRANDIYFVSQDRVFYNWDTAGTPQWLPIISAAAELDLLNHKQNQDDGTQAPDFIEAQHLDVKHRQSIDEGTASSKLYGISATTGTDFGAGNALVDELFPIPLRKRVPFTGLGAAVAVQVPGLVYVGKGSIGTAKNAITLAANGLEQQLVGSDNKPIPVLEVRDELNSLVIDPGSQADALGFFDSPFVHFDFSQTTDSTLNNVDIWYFTKSFVGQQTFEDVIENWNNGFAVPGESIPVQDLTEATDFTPPNFNINGGDLQTTLDRLFEEISRRVAKGGDVMRKPNDDVGPTLRVNAPNQTGGDGEVAFRADGSDGDGSSFGGDGIIANGGNGRAGAIGITAFGGSGTTSAGGTAGTFLGGVTSSSGSGGHGIESTGGRAVVGGDGIRSIGGRGDTGSGGVGGYFLAGVSAAGFGAHGVEAYAGGDDHAGIRAFGGAVNSPGVYGSGGVTSGTGVIGEGIASGALGGDFIGGSTSGDGLRSSGAGTGRGAELFGGANGGHGASITGGDDSDAIGGDGVLVVAGDGTLGGYGVRATGGVGALNDGGIGVYGQGGNGNTVAGVGVYGKGGGTGADGHGVFGVPGSAGESGVYGDGSGVSSSRGVTGIGQNYGGWFTAEAGTGGGGVYAQGEGSGAGGYFVGGGRGIYVEGGTSEAAYVFAAGNNHAVRGIGSGTGYGGYFTGGNTDASGVYAVGGAFNGHGIEAFGDGNGEGIRATGGSNSGHGVQGIGGSTAGRGGSFQAAGGGYGVYANSPSSYAGYFDGAFGVYAKSDAGNALYGHRESASTNTLQQVATFRVQSTGDATAGFGARINFELDDNGVSFPDLAYMEWALLDSTFNHASWKVRNRVNGVLQNAFAAGSDVTWDQQRIAIGAAAVLNEGPSNQGSIHFCTSSSGQTINNGDAFIFEAPSDATLTLVAGASTSDDPKFRFVGGSDPNDAEIEFDSSAERLLFRLRDSGSMTTEMVIDQDLVGVGTTSNRGQLSVQSSGKYTGTFYRSGAVSTDRVLAVRGISGSTTDEMIVRADGNVYNSNSIYGSLSDRRIKENIRPLRDTIDIKAIFQNVDPVEYSLKSKKKEKADIYGFIAQEIEPYAPLMIEPMEGLFEGFLSEEEIEESPLLGLNQSEMVPILFQAVKMIMQELNMIPGDK